MKKTKTIIVIIVALLILILAFIGVYYILNSKGDVSADNITYDSAEGIKFINNEVLIYFGTNVEKAKCQEIIKKIGGQVVSQNSSFNEYEVQLNQKFNSYDEIDKYCENLLNEYAEIETAGPNELYQIDS